MSDTWYIIRSGKIVEQESVGETEHNILFQVPTDPNLTNAVHKVYIGFNYFRTRKEAEAKLEKLAKLAKLAKLKERGLSVEDVLDRMAGIISEHPAAMEYDTDARYTWPARWDALIKYLKEKQNEISSISC